MLAVNTKTTFTDSKKKTNHPLIIRFLNVVYNNQYLMTVTLIKLIAGSSFHDDKSNEIAVDKIH